MVTGRRWRRGRAEDAGLSLWQQDGRDFFLGRHDVIIGHVTSRLLAAAAPAHPLSVRTHSTNMAPVGVLGQAPFSTLNLPNISIGIGCESFHSIEIGRSPWCSAKLTGPSATKAWSASSRTNS